MKSTEESLAFEIRFLKRMIKNLKVNDDWQKIDMLEHNLEITERDLKNLKNYNEFKRGLNK